MMCAQLSICTRIVATFWIFAAKKVDNLIHSQSVITNLISFGIWMTNHLQ